jgi:heme-degrading monooxygenase HmoA
MISRIWRGLAKPERADDYVQHLQDETFPLLTTIPGFIDAQILRRSVDRGVEFLVVTEWESLQSIQQFAGAGTDRAVVPQKVEEMMIDYDRIVRHYEVLKGL